MFISCFKIIDILSVYCVRIDLFTLMENDTDVHNFNVVYFLSAILMVADLCHFVFSCLPPERRKAKTRNMSFCHYFDLRISRRRHEDTTNKGRQNERFLPADTGKIDFRAFAC